MSPYYRWRPHPWHGLEVGPNPPQLVHAYIEITPFDFVKYEVDKVTGYLKVDRPQRTSSQPPALYGFIPQTYCGTHVNDLEPDSVRADGDPLDIVVVSERPIMHPEVILTARVVGGLRMIDNDESDDKIVGVLQNDSFWQHVTDIDELPSALVERLRHYFATYKLLPGEEDPVVMKETYDRAHALKVIEAAIQDYDETFALVG
ncbi:MAG: inorganic pyrophosphatase [Chloroflexota bacterium]|nr:MAG: inorganic pyrophosphatase [Chloroflexota bacterium]